MAMSVRDARIATSHTICARLQSDGLPETQRLERVKYSYSYDVCPNNKRIKLEADRYGSEYVRYS
eukprot:scaffold79007_cov35-Prasinocladus_malaysianus.AAC.1